MKKAQSLSNGSSPPTVWERAIAAKGGLAATCWYLVEKKRIVILRSW